MPEITFSEEGIQKLIKNLDASKARGPDNIPTRVLKEAIDEIAPPFTELFQNLL